jgi:excisionase family DNA binding protein
MSVKNGSTTFSAIPCLVWSDRHAAMALGTSVKKIQELARMKVLPGFKVGRQWWFDPEAIRSWVRTKGKSKESGKCTGAARV